MDNPKTFSGDFDEIDLWKVQSGQHFTSKNLADFTADANGDTAPNTGGYPQDASSAGSGWRRRSDGKIFIIREVTCGDARAAERIEAAKAKLNQWSSQSS